MKQIWMLVFALSSWAAHAQHSKIYYGLEQGVSGVKDDSNDLSHALARDLGGRAQVSQHAFVKSYKLLVGEHVTDHFAFEFGYVQSAALSLSFNGNSSAGMPYAGSQDAKFNGFEYVLHVQPSPSRLLGPLFLRWGFHSFTLNSTRQFKSTGASEFENKRGTGQLIGIGYDAELTAKLKLRMIVNRYTRIANQELGGNFYTIGLIRSF